MVPKKGMSHRAFIDYARQRGIHIRRITRTRVILEPTNIILPDNLKLKDHQIARLKYLDIHEKPTVNHLSIHEALKTNKYVQAISILRTLTGLGLMEAKYIIDANRNHWQ
jgi:hypothetical protein